MAMWSARPHKTTRRGARVRGVGERPAAGEKGVPGALGRLDETAAVHRQIVAPLRHVQAQALVVDDVDVGFQAGLKPAAVIEAKEARRSGRLALHHAL